MGGTVAVAFDILPGGREVCRKTPAGRLEYEKRTLEMYERDHHLCCLCGQHLPIGQITFEHLDGKGMNGSRHDDRTSENSVSHYWGNMAKGSMRIEKYLEFPLETRIKNCRGAL